MKIVLAGSMAFINRMQNIRDKLDDYGAIVTLPDDSDGLSTQSIRVYNDAARARIEDADILLVVNDRKHDIDGYVGTNTLIEIGMAYALQTPIYLLNAYDNNQPSAVELAGLIDGIVGEDIEQWLEKVSQ